jgi:DNA processing protein
VVLDAESVDFPTRLIDDPDPPAVLFVHGDHELLQTCGAAIVGTRRCTAYGRAVAKSCTDALADAGLTTWSGLATGIDTVAHQRALERGTPTVAVLGGGIDHWYPAANRRLASSILARGAVVSERPMGYRARRWDFPLRNRLIAALSDATVVVESGERGGSLSTIEESDLRGHPILAVPGPITSDQSRGSNLLLDGRCQPLVEPSELVLAVASRLVASSGAGRSAAEVEAALQRCHVSLRGCSTDPHDQVIAALDPDACAVLAVLTHDALSTESVVLATTMSVGQVVGALSRLHSHGLVAQSEGWWVRSVGVAAGSRNN